MRTTFCGSRERRTCNSCSALDYKFESGIIHVWAISKICQAEECLLFG